MSEKKHNNPKEKENVQTKDKRGNIVVFPAVATLPMQAET